MGSRELSPIAHCLLPNAYLFGFNTLPIRTAASR
jgi:hypothetical protein